MKSSAYGCWEDTYKAATGAVFFFLQSLPEAVLLSGTRSHSGREEQTAAGSAVFGFNPLHMEMCWEESSSSEPSCSPALG